MKKTKQNENPAPDKTLPAAPLEAAPNVSETDTDREGRVNRANQAIRDILKQENCILMVPSLDISTGRVFPQIQVIAQQLGK